MEIRPYEPVHLGGAAGVLARVEDAGLQQRHFDVAIVGESQYQDALRRAKNSARDYGGRAHVTAVLAREPDNQYDPGAVKVMNGALETMGYLSRELAAQSSVQDAIAGVFMSNVA